MKKVILITLVLLSTLSFGQESDLSEYTYEEIESWIDPDGKVIAKECERIAKLLDETNDVDLKEEFASEGLSKEQCTDKGFEYIKKLAAGDDGWGKPEPVKPATPAEIAEIKAYCKKIGAEYHSQSNKCKHMPGNKCSSNIDGFGYGDELSKGCYVRNAQRKKCETNKGSDGEKNRWDESKGSCRDAAYRKKIADKKKYEEDNKDEIAKKKFEAAVIKGAKRCENLGVKFTKSSWKKINDINCDVDPNCEVFDGFSYVQQPEAENECFYKNPKRVACEKKALASGAEGVGLKGQYAWKEDSGICSY